ncbi:hypothetical protein ACFVTY_36570, partial [Streptomyces sp. NPDC058067]|uniref:hypothetical protein n=1 Tax=Streptomyces sp. NPDC058067 TaxID=3346324 RepID=UPI0036E7BF64
MSTTVRRFGLRGPVRLPGVGGRTVSVSPVLDPERPRSFDLAPKESRMPTTVRRFGLRGPALLPGVGGRTVSVSPVLDPERPRSFDLAPKESR